MAEQLPLATGVVSGTGLTILYTVPSASAIHPFLVVSNNSTSIVEVTIILNNGVQDLELVKRKIPAGIGKPWRVLEVSDLRLTTGYALKLQLSGSSVNYFLSGVVFT